METKAFDPRSVVETDHDRAIAVWYAMEAEGCTYVPEAALLAR